MTTKARKTFSVETFRDRANYYLEKSKDHEFLGRVAVAGLLETVLFETNNYRGFRFIDGTNGTSDDSRRRYF